MNWTRVQNDKRNQPANGTYKDWKPAIAEDCDNRCVYCAIPDARFGGIRNFHVEHFRPKSKFEELENEIKNLYYACAICNILKRADWPGDVRADLSNAAYPDPADFDYGDLIDVDEETHRVDAPSVAARYLLERLYLNRPQLLAERRFHSLRVWIWSAAGRLDELCATLLSDKRNHEEALAEIGRVLAELVKCQQRLFMARPYEDRDTKR